MNVPARLKPIERNEINPKRIDTLVRDMGSPSAERLVGRAVEEIADRLAILEAAYHAGDPDGAVRSASHVIPVARAIGLETVARVAADVMATARSGDDAALGATVSRLLRLGDGAIHAIGEAWSATV